MNVKSTKKNSRVSAAVLLCSFAAIASVGLLLYALVRPDVHSSAAPQTKAPSRPVLPRNWRPSQTDIPPPKAGAREQANGEILRALADDPSSLSTTAAVEPFDRASFEANPERYLARVEPARCFQTAAPGPDVPPLEAKSPTRAVVQGTDGLALWVQGVPGAPVTFTSFDGGHFRENSFPSVTVRADARGLAVAHFVATAGTEGDVNVVVGSPMTVGTRKFAMRVARN